MVVLLRAAMGVLAPPVVLTVCVDETVAQVGEMNKEGERALGVCACVMLRVRRSDRAGGQEREILQKPALGRGGS